MNIANDRIPSTLSLHTAALAEPLSVVLQAFKRAQIAPASKVLVLGAGAVGLLTCSLAKASGCTTVIAVDIEQGKLDFAKEMGWATGIHLLPKGPRCSGADALEVAKSSWEGLRDSEVFKGVLGLEDGFDVVLECTGVESCMQMAVMVSPDSLFLLLSLPTHISPFVISYSTIHRELTRRPPPLGPK
jgi:L-iditol 2-dehydrogenase